MWKNMVQLDRPQI